MTRPRAGRPELEAGAGKSPTISVRVPASVHRVLADAAQARGVTIGDHARDVLTDHARAVLAAAAGLPESREG